MESLLPRQRQKLLFQIVDVKFGILHLYHVQRLLETFLKIGQKLCVQGHTKEFLYITAYGRFFMLVSFRILRLHKYNEIHIYFCYGQKQFIMCIKMIQKLYLIIRHRNHLA